MRPRRRAWSTRAALRAAPALLVPALAACLGDDTNSPLPDSGAPDASLADAIAVDTGSDAPPPPTVAALRVAHWAPGSPPVDFCVAKHGSNAFMPPFFAGLASALDAGGGSSPPALAYPSSSAYVDLPPGAYDLRAIAGGASDCSTPIVADLTSLPSLSAGMLATVALVGAAHPAGAAPPLALAGFLDDEKPHSGVALRAVNASPSLPTALFGTGTVQKSFAQLFAPLRFGVAGTLADAGAVDGGPSIDPNGYEAIKPLSGATLSVHAPGAAADSVVAPGVYVAGGSVITFVVLDGTSEGSPASLLECVDNAGTSGPLGSCSVIAP